MATTADWVEGARLRTLPAAISPVLAGTGLAVFAGGPVWWKALLALVVAVALQVAVNYANDYSDGVRGTDAQRVGPMRLVGSGAATPKQVKGAAIAAFAVAAAAGLAIAGTTAWWLLALGAAAMLAAWFYTGGSRPYGYRGLGEVSVFVFFGLVAVVGTTYAQLRTVPAQSLLIGCGVGALACAILVVNNLRDIPTDRDSGKHTLAVRFGDRAARQLYLWLLVSAYAVVVAAGATLTWWALVAFVSLPLSVRAALAVRRGTTGLALVGALRDTGLAELTYAAGLLAGLVVALT
ncbi:MAG TPA: 1,4-dihydroxy-2-naphthoate polyprenyltransferase [Nocardioidaceae bacterium]|nr:1,4-dihydroxy-2-naphthoate polyprenyltransferase [Nocardioidaceae bacterium]